jgi:mono/diheme cytochrome c family protein
VRIAAAVVLSSFLALGLGRCTRESIEGDSVQLAPSWAQKEGFAGNERAVAGAQVFAQAGCLTCHTYLGGGSRNVGAGDLTAIGRDSQRTESEFAAYVANPSAYGNEVMPRFNALGRKNLVLLGAFLRASKGRR